MSKLEKAAVAHMTAQELLRIESSLREALEATSQQEPVLVVEREPSYMDRGHFYKGDKPHIDPTKVWKLPIGTKLCTAPLPTRQPLTSEQIDEIAEQHRSLLSDGQPYFAWYDYARAIERAHGITGETA